MSFPPQTHPESSARSLGATRKPSADQWPQITVRLDNGELRAIAQEADEEFRPGERVRLVTGGGKTRVTH